MKMKNKIIPATLAVVLAIGVGMMFAPVEQATTVHTTFILPGTMGLACATESVAMTTDTNAVDNDIVELTILVDMTIERITISEGAAGDLAGDTIGFDAMTLDGKTVTVGATAEDIDDASPVEITEEMGIFTLQINAGDVLALTIDDNDGTLVDDTDLIDFEICGLVADPANFDGADITSAVTEA